MVNIISSKPEVYEKYRGALRSIVPVPEKVKLAISHAINRVHQRFFQNYSYIHINKCGGTSLERALGIPLINHDTALIRKKALGESVWNERFSFTLVRNPYHRILSAYFYLNQNRVDDVQTILKDLPYWLENLVEQSTLERSNLSLYYGPMSAWVTDEKDNLMVDEVFKLEDLGTCESRLTEKLSRPIIIKHVKRRIHAYDGRKILQDKAIKSMIFQLVEPDFDLFGYRK